MFIVHDNMGDFMGETQDPDHRTDYRQIQIHNFLVEIGMNHSPTDCIIIIISMHLTKSHMQAISQLAINYRSLKNNPTGKTNHHRVSLEVEPQDHTFPGCNQFQYFPTHI